MHREFPALGENDPSDEMASSRSNGIDLRQAPQEFRFPSAPIVPEKKPRLKAGKKDISACSCIFTNIIRFLC
jgi:hypothetical protein